MEKKTNKIKIVTYDNFPFGGAPANFVRYFALSLSLIPENNIEVILPTGNYGNINNINKSKSGKIDHVNYRHLGFVKHPKFSLGKFADILLGIIIPITLFLKLRVQKEADKLILYNTRFSVTIWYLFIKWLTGIELIIILPEYYEKPTKRISLKYLQWVDFYLGIEYLVKRADKFIVLSTFMKSFLIKKKIKETAILLIPNVIDCDFFMIDNMQQFKQECITIGYCGTPTRKDGIDDLITSFHSLTKNLKGVHLLIIGDSANGPSLIPELYKKVKEMKIDDKVTFTGHVPFQEIPGLLNSCQILALIRPDGIFAKAGFPTKLGEYFACKKPVLITGIGDIPLYFQNKKHVIISKPGDIEDIKNGFIDIIMNKNEYEGMAENAYVWMNENLNYKNISKKLIKFILS